MLDLDSVDLAELAEALADNSHEHWWWLDPTTGELHFHSDFDDVDPDDIDGVRVEPVGSHESYRDMADFTSMVRDPRARDLLTRAIDGRGAFRRFKDTLFEYPDLRQAWFALEEARMSRRAVEWLIDKELVDPGQAGIALERFADPRFPDLLVT